MLRIDVKRIHHPCQLLRRIRIRIRCVSPLHLQGHNLTLLVHEDRAHDLQLLVLDAILLVGALEVF